MMNANVGRRARFIPATPTGWLFCLMLTFWAAIRPAAAQDDATVLGVVKNGIDGQPLRGANVEVIGTPFGSSTNSRGEFRLSRLPAGEIRLRVSFIGFAPDERILQVMAGDTALVQFELWPQPLLFDEVVVTASREPEKVQNAVVSVSTLPAEAALRRSTLRLDAVLETVPGVNVIGENVNIRNSTGYTRGLGSRVLVLLDGVPVLISDLGNMNWDIIPVTDIERVEVVKGPASALYGSFALGGVINIITRHPEKDARMRVRFIAGVYDRPYYPQWRWTDRTLNFNRTDVSYSRKIGNWGFRVTLGRHESTGDRENRHFQRWNATAKLIWTPDERSEWVAFVSYARDRRGEFVESRFDHPYRVPPEQLPFRLRIDAWAVYMHYRRQINPWLEAVGRVSYVRQLTGNQYNVPGDFKPAQGPGANFQLNARLDSSVTYSLGVEYHYDFAEQRHFGRHFSYTVSPYLQQKWQLGERLRITAGLRFDHYYLLPTARVQTQFANLDSVINPLYMGKEEQHINPQLGFSYQFSPATVIHAALGRGIRIPALGERFLQFKIPIEFRPNAKIRTERSLSYELGLRQRMGRWLNFQITGFVSYYKDLIEPVYVADVTQFYATLVNIPESRIAGVELASSWRLWRNRLQLEANATWTEPVILRTARIENTSVVFRRGQLLSYRPRLIAFISPSLQVGAFQFSADYSYASKLTRDQVQLYKDDPRVPKKQLDVRVTYTRGPLMLQFQVRNVLQYHYTQLERNMNEVRNFSIGVLWQH